MKTFNHGSTTYADVAFVNGHPNNHVELFFFSFMTTCRYLGYTSTILL